MKQSKIITLSLSTAIALSASTMQVKSGWQLYGVSSEIDLDRLKNSCIEYIWKYDNNKKSWEALVLDGNDYGYSGDTITSIKRQDAVWMMANSDCNVTVNDLIEESTLAPNTPYIVSPKDLVVDENEQEIKYLVSKGTTATLSYAIVGGSEYEYFEIDPDSGLLKFKNIPDYENPLDINKENIYEVRVEVSAKDINDDTKILKSEKTFKIKVNDTEDVFHLTSKFYDIIGQNLGTNAYRTNMYTLEAIGGEIASASATITKPDSTTANQTLRNGNQIYLYNDLLGTYSVELTVTDKNGNTTTQTFTYEVLTQSSIAMPTISDMSVDIRSNVTTKLDLPTKDNAGYSLYYVVTQAPTHGTLIYKNGSLYYKSAYNYMGSDSFTYSATNNVNSSVAKTVSINVISSNSAPVVEDRVVETNEERSVIIKLFSKDEEFDDITYSVDTSTIYNGTLTKISNDTYEYTPKTDFFGQETFTYKANDGTSYSNTGRISLKVYNINDAPTINEKNYTIEPKFISKSFVIDQNSLFIRETTKARDVDGDNLTFNISKTPQNGSILMAKDGGYVYVPNYGFVGTDSFTYQASDGVSNSSIVTVNIVVKPISNTTPKPVTQTNSILSVSQDGKEITETSYEDDAKTKRGVAQSFTRNSNGIVVDNVTGLMWQDDGDNLTNKDNIVTDSLTKELVVKKVPKQYTIDEANNYCTNLGLGGYNDWRVPSETETRTILDYSKESRTASDFTIGTQSIYVSGANMTNEAFKYIASDRVEGIAYVRAWYMTTTKEQNKYDANYKKTRRMTFLEGMGRALGDDETSGVMCVRGDWVKQSTYLKDDKKKIIFDLNTNLMWQDDEDLQYSYVYNRGDGVFATANTYEQPLITNDLNESIDYCKNLQLGGFNDWKVPNANELETLGNDNASNSALIMDNTKDNKEFSAINFLLSNYVSSTSSIKKIKTKDLETTTGYEVGYYMPWDELNLKTTEAEFEATAEGGDFYYAGLNWKACTKQDYKGKEGDPVLSLNKFMWSKGLSTDSIYENSECRKVMAKYNYLSGKESFSKDVSTTYTVELPHGNLQTNPSLTGYTRCVRISNDIQKQEFINDIAKEALANPPASENWVYDKVTKKMTNTINGITTDRFVDNNDGTVTDKMTKVIIYKDIDSIQKINPDNGLKIRMNYDEALVKLPTIDDGKFSLPPLELYADIQDWVESGYLVLPSMMSYVDHIWSSKTDDNNETKAYTLYTNKKEPHKEFLIIKEKSFDDSILFPIKLDRLVADAGVNKRVQSGETITLDGSRSYEGLNPSNIKYKWEFIASNREYSLNFGWIKTVRKVDITNSDSKNASFVVPNVDKPQNLRFRLTISNDLNQTSSEDVDFSVYKNNFEKLDADGNKLAEDATDYKCVKDTETNLVWEAKTESNMNDLYTFAQAQNTYITNLNTNTLCGVSNWRLPSKEEFEIAKEKYNIKSKTNVMHEMGGSYYADEGLKYLYWITNTNHDSLIDDVNYKWAGRYSSYYSWPYTYGQIEAIHTSTPTRVWAVSGN